MLMLDLCSGLGGASQAMKTRGWQVITLDYEAAFGCDITADVRDWQYPDDWPIPDLIWASPPCDEFSREFMPWCKTGKAPDMSIVLGCKRIIDECAPTFWVIENVKGAIRYFKPIFGSYRVNYGPFYLWGRFPDLGNFTMRMRKKQSFSSSASAERARVPEQISRSLALAVESQPLLLHPYNTACTRPRYQRAWR